MDNLNDIVYWIWLSLACRPSGSTFGKLIGEYKDAREIYYADDKTVSSIIGYRNSDRASLSNKDLNKAQEVFEFCRKYKVGILVYCDENYPENLRKIANPPVLLYYRGKLPDFNKRFFVAAVGTRSISAYGRKHSFKISYDLASSGAIIVSGMATGIDGVAMAGAMTAGGITVAVIGSGIDICYPPQHLHLAREIVKEGCVITEYCPGTKPSKHSFPERNRIISGLAAATIVFEGSERSGALITARCAKEQERPVYALPANVDEKNGQLTSLLIKNGAKICTCAEDVICDFIDKYPSSINLFKLHDGVNVDMMECLRKYSVSAVCPGDDIFVPSKGFKNSSNITSSADSSETTENRIPILPPEGFDKLSLDIYKKIPTNEPCNIESLVDENTGLREVMKCLLKLEVGGFIQMLPGEMVSRKFR